MKMNMSNFRFDHLPKHLQETSREICLLAYKMDKELPEGDEKQIGLRKLLEAKDCFVRSTLGN